MIVRTVHVARRAVVATTGVERLLAALVVALAVGALADVGTLRASRAVAAVAPRLAVSVGGVSDPWGRPWCEHRAPYGAPFGVVWSAGPDGVDQGGGGDDVLLRDAPQGCPVWPLLAAPGWTCALAALLLTWATVARRLAAARGPELPRVVVLLLPVVAAVVWATRAFLKEDAGRAAEPSLLVVPLPVAAWGTTGSLLLALGFSGWQLLRAVAAEDRDARTARAVLRWWVPLSVCVCAALPLVVVRMKEVSERDFFLAVSRLRLVGWAQTRFHDAHGRPGSADELVESGMVPRRVVGSWRGYRIDLRLGAPTSSPPWVAVASPLPGTTVGQYHLAIAEEQLYLRTSPHPPGPLPTLDGYMGQSW